MGAFRSEALRAFNAAGSPLYFVLDSSGAIRFEYTQLERVLAEAVTLVPEQVKVSNRRTRVRPQHSMRGTRVRVVRRDES